METITETITTLPIKKTADKTAYMREYKRKQYQEKGEGIRERNKQYYYRNKFGMSAEDMKTYGNLLPLIAKIKNNLEELEGKDPTIIQVLFSKYIPV